MSNLNSISPMAEINRSELSTDDNVLAITEHAFLGHVNIRGASDNKKFTAAAKKALGEELPTQANTFLVAGENTVLWLGPNEWLVITPHNKATALIEKLEKLLADIFSAVNDVSGGNTVLEISGDKAQALLRKGCPLDLHHSVFSTGQCAQTVIAKTSMILWQTDDAPVYKLVVRRSFADYLGLWLADATREYRA
ncbi:MAG: sarcosine oxidase subunit gamma [Arenicella sp.]|jgi:sarcosine oxidase subunit gamma